MMPGYIEIIRADDRVRRDLFQTTSLRLGTPAANIEKDFWVCLTLEALFNWPMENGAQLLFKGGTSLSKAWGLISRFSEDIDVSLSRDDLGAPGEAAELAALGSNQRRKRLEAIKAASERYIADRLLPHLRDEVLRSTFEMAARETLPWRIEVDPTESQTLLFSYPSVLPADDGYVSRAVKIEMGAKAAFDPHEDVTILPYLAEDAQGLPFEVGRVPTIRPERTFWDKVLIAHELKARFAADGRLQGDGQRLTRHYYDLHRMMRGETGPRATTDRALGAACLEHRLVFFPGRKEQRATGRAGEYRLVPEGEMERLLREDYARMTRMVFGRPPEFEEVMASIGEIERRLNESA